MTPENLIKFKALLLSKQKELTALSAASVNARKPVELDQQSVGRLSRQDALQQQAMAKAQEERRNAEIRKIESAFKRIESEDYGYCEECGEDIALKRLEIDLTAQLCAPCASGNE